MPVLSGSQDDASKMSANKESGLFFLGGLEDVKPGRFVFVYCDARPGEAGGSSGTRKTDRIWWPGIEFMTADARHDLGKRGLVAMPSVRSQYLSIPGPL